MWNQNHSRWFAQREVGIMSRRDNTQSWTHSAAGGYRYLALLNQTPDKKNGHISG